MYEEFVLVFGAHDIIYHFLTDLGRLVFSDVGRFINLGKTCFFNYVFLFNIATEQKQ